MFHDSPSSGDISQRPAAEASAKSSGRSFEPRPSRGQVGKRLELAPAPAPSEPTEQQMASDKSMPSSADTKKKPKRELPPYLRVVK